MQRHLPAMVLAAAYAFIAVSAFLGGSSDDRIVSLLFLFVLVAGLLGAAVMRFRPVPMSYLLWILAAAQTLILFAALSAQVGDPGVVAFINILLIAGMVATAAYYGRAAGD